MHRVSFERVYMFSGLVTSAGISCLMQGIYAFIYYNEFAFFEQYKVLEDEWPWKSDPVRWRQYLLPKSIAIWALNMLIISPLTYTIPEVSG